MKLTSGRTVKFQNYQNDVMMEVGDIAEVLISFSGDSILLVAGEVEEEFDGQLIDYRLDGSILLFRNPEKKKDVNFHFGPSCAWPL